MLVYPVLHFVYTDFVASIVPPWIPWHLFWTYFTAGTIFAAGLAMVFRKYDHLAALLLGIEISLFCLLIHVFLLLRLPGDTWAARPDFGAVPNRWVNAPKDLGMAGACFVLAAGRWGYLRTLGRLILAISLAWFGVLHFVYPVFAPGIPPMQPEIGFPLPGRLFWVDLTGAALIAGAVSIGANRYTKQVALALGLMILAFDLLDWMPAFVSHPIQLTGNWLKDLGVAGGVFLLAER